jgi:hypothetical protein
MKNKHIIRRQRFRFQTEGKAEAELAFSKTSTLVRDRLTPLLDELFSEFAPGEETIRIDSLQLDIGDISPENFEEEVTERMLKLLRERLTGITSGPTTDATSLSQPDANYELLAFFLRRGHLPWWASEGSMPSMPELLLVVLENSPKRLYFLFQELQDILSFRNRLKYQFSYDSLQVVKAKFLSSNWKGVADNLFQTKIPLLTLEAPPVKDDLPALLAGRQQQNISATASSASENTPHSMEESMYVHNSGLVILAAYFKRYFGLLDMLDGEVFRSEEGAIRGVLLLEYLASGRTEVGEHELAFNKVLCGLDVTTPVPTTLELTEQEVEISEQMLNAILQNWDKMSGSTVENLRGSFLLREGLLREHDAHWSLQVTSAGYDILLSFLPWTISVISLPWVDKRLEVEWNTQPS